MLWEFKKYYSLALVPKLANQKPHCIKPKMCSLIDKCLLFSEGLLLHMIRKPSTEMLLAAGGINVQSSVLSQICASMPRFRSLIAACTTDANVVENTTVSGTRLGGIGSDPVFNRWVFMKILALMYQMHDRRCGIKCFAYEPFLTCSDFCLAASRLCTMQVWMPLTITTPLSTLMTSIPTPAFPMGSSIIRWRGCLTATRLWSRPGSVRSARIRPSRSFNTEVC